MQKKFSDFGKDEKITPLNNPNCTNCNDCCCMTAALTELELETIIKYIESDKMILDKMRNKIVALNNTYKKGTTNFKCLFTNEKDRKCLIYHIRPKVCRDFHCDNIQHAPIEDQQKYLILHVFNYMINSYFGHKNEYMKLAQVYQLSYEQFIGNYFQDMLKKEGK